MSDENVPAGCAVVLVVVAAAAAFVIGGCVADSGNKLEAAKHGFAEYYIDQNNERQWRWKSGPATEVSK